MDSTIANVDLGRYRRLVQLFWNPEPSNDTALDQPAWCLGCAYKLSDEAAWVARASDKPARGPPSPTPSSSPEQNQGNNTQSSRFGATKEAPFESFPDGFSSAHTHHDVARDVGGWPKSFVDDFGSRFWMTYRSGFDPIPRSDDPKATSFLSLSMRIKGQLGNQTGFSSDSGWGCMIRSGQSLLANAMGILQLGRDWRRGHLREEECRLISLFADDSRAPYSIHNFVHHGSTACGKYPGEWFGPSATARCIQALVNKNEPYLKVYSTGDCSDVYEDNFMRVAKPDGHGFNPTLILIGTRLGIDKITPVYWEALAACLQMPHSVGIAGGRPSSSHYLVGVQGSYFFYLDPHHTRPALPYHSNISQYTNEHIDSCHTYRLHRIHVRELDPSMLIGFLIRNEDDWLEWRQCVKQVQGKAIIHIADQDVAHQTAERENAVDEVEPLSDDDSDIDVAA